MTRASDDSSFEVVELCAGAGGQALGLDRAGFKHRLAVELDANAFQTLRTNIRGQIEINEEKRDIVLQGDVADPAVFNPEEHHEVALLAAWSSLSPVHDRRKAAGRERRT